MAHWDLALCEAMVQLSEIFIDNKFLYIVQEL
jgi:hypothetical protein